MAVSAEARAAGGQHFPRILEGPFRTGAEVVKETGRIVRNLLKHTMEHPLAASAGKVRISRVRYNPVDIEWADVMIAGGFLAIALKNIV